MWALTTSMAITPSRALVMKICSRSPLLGQHWPEGPRAFAEECTTCRQVAINVPLTCYHPPSPAPQGLGSASPTHHCLQGLGAAELLLLPASHGAACAGAEPWSRCRGAQPSSGGAEPPLLSPWEDLGLHQAWPTAWAGGRPRGCWQQPGGTERPSRGSIMPN